MNPAQNKKQEKKGATAVGSAAERLAVQTISRAPAIAVRGVVQQGLIASVANFFTTGAGMLTLTAMIAGTSFFSLWDLNRQKQAALEKRHASSLFNSQTNASQGSNNQAAQPGAPASNGDSLSFLFTANRSGAESAGSQYSGGQQGGADASSAQPALQSNEQVASQPAASQSKGADAPAAAQSAVQAALGNRFGQMSTGTGGGSSNLAGGSGMASGIGRQFESKLSQPTAMRNASSQSGATASSAGVGRTAVSGGGGSRGAMGQLRFANGASIAAKSAGSSEGSSYQATQAFEGGHAIASPDATQTGGIGDASGASDQVGGAGVDNGTAVKNQPQGGGGGSSNQSTPSAGAGTDVTPWEGLVEIGQALLAIAGILLLIAGIIPAGPYWPYKKTLAKIAMVLAGLATIIGIVIMTAYGQVMQGGILTAIAALTTALAAYAAFGPWSGPSPVDTAKPPAAPVSTAGASSGGQFGFAGSNGLPQGYTVDSEYNVMDPSGNVVGTQAPGQPFVPNSSYNPAGLTQAQIQLGNTPPNYNPGQVLPGANPPAGVPTGSTQLSNGNWVDPNGVATYGPNGQLVGSMKPPS